MNNSKAKVSIRKGKFNQITVYYDTEWCKLYVNGFSYYEGEVIPDSIWLELLELMAGAQTDIVIEDELTAEDMKRIIRP